MAEGRVRIGILGAGSMGTTHAGAYGAIDGVEVAGVWGRTVERALAVARVCGAGVVADARALIDSAQIDAIDVCVPTHAHREFVVAALAAGKHVICETPVALGTEDAEAMIAAARAANRLFFVGLLMRSVADYIYLRDEVRSGDLGALRSIALWRLGSYLRRDDGDVTPHYGDPSTELMSFDFDILDWLLGPAESLSAGAALTEAKTVGEITAVLRYAGGASAVVSGSGIMPMGYPYTVGYRAVLDYGVIEHRAVFDNGIPESTLVVHAAGRLSAPLRLRRNNPYESELRHCIDSIRKGTPSELLRADNALAALRLSLATQRSLRDGRTVYFDATLN